MAIKRINIGEFIKLSEENLIVDVRSPGEFTYAHIPGAYSLPLFSDEERKVVGTAYKKESRENAIKIGLDYFGSKMRKMVVEVEILAKEKSKKILVHCWRGGMRSSAIAWLLDLYGFEVYQLDGGYKAYRNWVLNQFEKSITSKIIGGFTGTGKTYLLNELVKKGFQVVDLENLANHKGSTLGGINQPPQPSQEMFENLLGMQISKFDVSLPIFFEDESQRIGQVNLPLRLWQTMKSGDLFFIEIPFEKRIEFLVKEYGVLPQTELKNGIIRIQKRLGGLETKNAIEYIENGNIKECFRILLSYYDKWYTKGVASKEKGSIFKLESNEVSAKLNAQLVINKLNEKNFSKS